MMIVMTNFYRTYVEKVVLLYHFIGAAVLGIIVGVVYAGCSYERITEYLGYNKKQGEFMLDNEKNRMVYSYKILISKEAVREKYDSYSLKNHIMFKLHGYTYNPYDRINYTIKLSLKEMVLTMTKKDGRPFSKNERAFFDRILSEFFEESEVEFIQEKEMRENEEEDLSECHGLRL